MKKLIGTSFGYAVAALAGGVFYREFTKLSGFSGQTPLGVVHTRLFVLGMIFFLLLALLNHRLDLWENRRFRLGFPLYNAGLIIAVGSLVVRGVVQVVGLALSRAADASLSGVAGLGHILLGAGMVLFFVAMLQQASVRSAAKQQIPCI